MQQQGPSDLDQLQGVSFDSKRGVYKARLFFKGHERYIGRYSTSEEAALAYDQAARFINSIVAASEPSEGPSRRRPRPLNFPTRCLNDPKIAQKLQQLLAQTQADSAAPAVLEAANLGAGHFSTDVDMLAAAATPGSCSELQVQFWDPAHIMSQAGGQQAAQHLQHNPVSADTAEVLAAFDAAAAASAGAEAVGTELLHPAGTAVNTSAGREAAAAEGETETSSSSGADALPGAMHLHASRKRTATTMEQHQQHQPWWQQQQQQQQQPQAGQASMPQASPLTVPQLAAAAGYVPNGHLLDLLLLQLPQQQQQQSSTLTGPVSLLDPCSMPLTHVDTLDDKEWSDLLAVVGLQGFAPDSTAGGAVTTQHHTPQHPETGQQQQQLAGGMQSRLRDISVSPPLAARMLQAAGSVLQDAQVLPARASTSCGSGAGSGAQQQQQQWGAGHTADAVWVGPGDMLFSPAPAGAGAAAGSDQATILSLPGIRQDISASALSVQQGLMTLAALPGPAGAQIEPLPAWYLPQGPAVDTADSLSQSLSPAAAAAAPVAAAGAGAALAPSPATPRLLPCALSRFQALATVNMALHFLDDLGTHLLAHPVQIQHQQGNSSSSSSRDATHLQAMSEWLQLAWLLEVMSGGGLPAAAAPGVVSAAIAAARAAPTDPAAPNRLALQLLDRLLLVLRESQGAASTQATNTALAAAPRRGAIDSVVLTVLLQLQQGLTEVQQAIRAAAPGAPVDVKQVLQAHLENRDPAHSIVMTTAVLKRFAELL